MEIGIFESDHFEGAYPVIKLFDNGQNQITIFTYESCFLQFAHLFKDSMQKYKWVVKKPSESKYEFIYRIYKISKHNKFDILYLNTIGDNHLLYAIMVSRLKNMRIITTLHDINSYFSFQPDFSIRRWVRYRGKRRLIQTINEFNVVSSTMVEYLRKKLPPFKKVHCIPGSVFEETARPPAHHLSRPIKIAVPGTIDVRRRNYQFVFDLLKAINKKNLNVTIILLGGYNVHGKLVLDWCREYSSTHHNLNFYETKVVEQPEFDKKLDDTDFIFTPSVINTTISDGIQETYGVSISSGNVFDVIKHAKPFIIPAGLKIPPNLETSCFRYKSVQDIIVFLESFIAKPDSYYEWKEKALQNSRCYTVEKIRSDNPALFA
jgi:hypothetical protein